MQEAKQAYSSWFVTLTYNTDYVPLTKRGFMTLVKTSEQYEKMDKQNRYEDKDISAQAFVKRLRYYQEERLRCGKIDLEQYRRSRLTSGGLFCREKIKYYLVGEYGSKRFRPHYHLVLFNCISKEDIKSAWTFGDVWIDEVNQNTVEYTLKYICKPPVDKRKGFDGIKEFSLMSKGLGKNYFTEDAKQYHAQDYANYVVNKRGIKVALPRYYGNAMEGPKDNRKPVYNKKIKEEKAIFMAQENQKRENEERRIASKYGLSYDDVKVRIAMANKEKLKKPIKDRGGR